MRVLLIQPPSLLNPDEIPQYSPPLGLAYLAAVLRERDHTVHILDCIIESPHGRRQEGGVHIGLDWDAIAARCAEYSPQVVGISSMFSSQSPYMHRVAQVVKSLDRGLITVVGGAHPSALPRETLQDGNVDFVVIGEGEETLLNLLESLSDPQRIATVDGIGYKSNGRVIINAKTHFIQNLDGLPFPAWDQLQMEKYARLSVGHGPFVQQQPFFSVITSRGCPGICLFCSIQSVCGRGWRPRSPSNVADEIQTLTRRYGVREIQFEDDCLLMSRQRTAAICDEINARKLSISWCTPNGVNINHVTRDLLVKMRGSGCYALSFGIESGDEYIRNKVVGKPIAVEHARQVIKWCHQLSIWTNGFFVLGFPGESPKTFQETIDFAKGLGLDSASFFIATPLPGSKLLKVCQEQGYLSEGLELSKMRVASASISTDAFSPEDLLRWRRRAYQEFGRYALKRELLHLNILRRLSRVRSRKELRLFIRLAKRFLQLL